MSPLGAAAASTANQVFILDASGSMWGQIEGKHKIQIAREVMGGLIQGLADDSQVALVAYGHRRKGDCSDIETLAPVGPLDKAGLIETINGLNPKGKTPITDAINQAIELVRSSEGASNLILVSDGLETCGGDPCRAVMDAKAAGIRFVMHVVGFGIAESDDVASLECVAQAGGGLYFDAQSAEQLSAALQQAVETPVEVSGGYLSIKAVANGELADAAISVREADTGTEAAGARTYRSEQTNPRRILLPAGRYQATVKALGMEGDIQREIDGIEITDGETVEHSLDFSTGRISIKVVRDGALGDAAVNVTRAGDGASVAAGRTYEGEATNPALFELTPGRYRVAVEPVKLKGGSTQVLEDLVVEPGATIERVVDFSSGRLTVRVLQNGAPADATIAIQTADTAKPVAQGRSYARGGEGKTFTLVPGRYRVTVKPIGLKGGEALEWNQVEVTAGKTLERVAEFTSGAISVRITENGQLTDASVSVQPAGGGVAMDQGRLYPRPKTNPRRFELGLGRYDVEVKALGIGGEPRHRFEGVEVAKGAVLELAHDFATGTVEVTTLNVGQPVDAAISLVDSAGKTLAQGRSYGKAKSFRLPPGSYEVKAKAIRLKGSEPPQTRVTIEAGGSAEVRLDFALGPD